MADAPAWLRAVVRAERTVARPLNRAANSDEAAAVLLLMARVGRRGRNLAEHGRGNGRPHPEPAVAPGRATAGRQGGAAEAGPGGAGRRPRSHSTIMTPPTTRPGSSPAAARDRADGDPPAQRPEYAAGAEGRRGSPTPSDVVWRQGTAELRRYRSATCATGSRWCSSSVSSAAATSSTCTARTASPGACATPGLDVYLLDWGTPGPADATNTLETYVLRYLPRALRAALARRTPSRRRCSATAWAATWRCSGWPARSCPSAAWSRWRRRSTSRRCPGSPGAVSAAAARPRRRSSTGPATCRLSTCRRSSACASPPPTSRTGRGCGRTSGTTSTSRLTRRWRDGRASTSRFPARPSGRSPISGCGRTPS